MEFLLISLRMCVISTTLIILVFLQNRRILSSADTPPPVCRTPECERLGHLYLHNINPRRNPCENFYEYACGRWRYSIHDLQQVNPEMMMNSNSFMEFQALQALRKIFESVVYRSKESDRARQLYQTCMQSPYLERSNPNAIRDVVKDNAVFPFLLAKNVSLPDGISYGEIDLTYMKLAGESAFFDYSIEATLNEYITKLEPLTSAYGSLIRVQHWLKQSNELQHYKSFLTKLVKSMSNNKTSISEHVIEDDIDALIVFRESLNTIISKQESYKKRDETTIQDFQKWYDKESNAPKGAEVNWLSMIRAIYKSSDDSRLAKVRPKSNLKVHSPYFAQLTHLLKNTPTRTIVNHIHLYFVERHTEMDFRMKLDLQRSITDCGVDGTGSVRGDMTRWKKCVETNNMKDALQKAYVRLNFPISSKKAVRGLFEKGKELLKQLVVSSTWLDPETKNMSIAKVNRIKGRIGYPDWFDLNSTNLLTRPSSMDINPLEPRAEYEYDTNRVSVTAANLQPPLYTPNVPYVIDYGSTMNLLGHELHHAFDEEGIHINANGKKPWWPITSCVDHTLRKKCFKQQYDMYKENVLTRIQKTVNISCINYEDTVSEDIVDVMGLKLAYRGFQELFEKDDDGCSVLPGFETFGCEKLFFIAFANNFCSHLSDGDKEVLFTHDSHNLPEIRVNGAVSNMREFTIAFDCTPKDPMYAKRVCDIWK